MTTPLQSPEYAALVAAKEARDKAYADFENAQKVLLGTSSLEAFSLKIENAQRRIMDAAQKYESARVLAVRSDAAVTAAQAAFDAAYPAPADVVDAVEAADSEYVYVRAYREDLTPHKYPLGTRVTIRIQGIVRSGIISRADQYSMWAVNGKAVSVHHLWDICDTDGVLLAGGVGDNAFIAIEGK